MKRNILFFLGLVFCVTAFTACAKGSNTSTEPEDNGGSVNNQKTLVVYFSCTNNTKGIADHITKILDATEFGIVPSEPYTSADLNYSDNNCRANREQNNDAARPAIANAIANIANYDIIYVGFPIWWGKLPKIMFTFFDTYDFKGKTIIPFCTSGSSGIGTAVGEIRSLEPNATVNDGTRFSSGTNESTVKSWVDKVQPKNSAN